jgi:hypothetical protein
MAYTKSRVRIGFTLGDYTPAVDAITSKTPAFFRGNDVQFELVGIFKGALIDISAVTGLTLEIKPSDPITGTALFTGTQSAEFGTSVTKVDWDAGTAQQFLIPMTAAQNNIDLQSNLVRVCWLVARATCTGGSIFTLGTSLINVVEDGF